jgi:nucleoside-diphosphate-sugar epimerase
MISKENKIFVTGATGFVGSYIVRKLIKEGFSNITCLKRQVSSMDLVSDVVDHIHWVEGDILDLSFLEEALVSFDLIIHAAADVTFSLKNKKKVIETALTGTANLVNAALFCQVPKFIHISSIAAIGRKKLVDHIDEKDLFSHSPYDTTYGLSKFLAEQEVWRGHAEGLHVTVLCPSMVLGAGDFTSSSPKLFTKISKGLRFYPLGTNGWVDVRDVATAVYMVAVDNHDGQRYIISAQNLKYQDVFNQIAIKMNVARPSQPITNLRGNIFWRLEAIKSWIMGSEPVFTKETFMSTSVTAIYDNSKSAKELGINYTNIDQTITDTVQSFLDAKKLGKDFAIVKDI